jgi:hypothetical protein
MNLVEFWNQVYVKHFLESRLWYVTPTNEGTEQSKLVTSWCQKRKIMFSSYKGEVTFHRHLRSYTGVGYFALQRHTSAVPCGNFTPGCDKHGVS